MIYLIEKSKKVLYSYFRRDGLFTKLQKSLLNILRDKCYFYELKGLTIGVFKHPLYNNLGVNMEEKLAVSSKEEKLDKEIEKAIKEMKSFGYVPTYFIRMRNEYGSVEAIKRLLNKDGLSDGMVKLWENNRLDLCMENIIQSAEYRELFTDEEIKKAKQRIEKMN